MSLDFEDTGSGHFMQLDFMTAWKPNDPIDPGSPSFFEDQLDKSNWIARQWLFEDQMNSGDNQWDPTYPVYYVPTMYLPNGIVAQQSAWGYWTLFDEFGNEIAKVEGMRFGVAEGDSASDYFINFSEDGTTFWKFLPGT
jgi:hypothetical protein